MSISGGIVIVFGFICYIVLRVIILVLKLKQKRSVFWLKELIRFLFVLYILMVASVTLFPLYIGASHIEFSYKVINYIPLISIFRDISQVGIAYSGDTLFMIKLIVRNVGGNILMFMPLGFLLPLLWGKFKRLKNTIIIGLIISLSIESLQFVQCLFGVVFTRTIDIDDVICNVLGTFLGFCIYKLIILVLGKSNLRILTI
ncbi:glycopeptide antibiotics resistance protein [Cytobacillus eiseniae]|uniref:Glycopeptide antibiotics resistance protein n=1 Tax=Cytobacillus eiseniae TaxID=762947 RepID=A0ABS4RL20_9BACI|nr:VanZ family protein [Cytobacillus eiseniae]MBP2243060.1 glycopeptide antibiotics resistance protein [Cytobacillus eiseniae]